MATCPHHVNGATTADRGIRVGVGVVVLNKENRVLIGMRKSPHGQGTSRPIPSNSRNMVFAWCNNSSDTFADILGTFRIF